MDRHAGGLACGIDHCRYLLLARRISDKRLIEQDKLLKPLADLPLDDLYLDIVRLLCEIRVCIGLGLSDLTLFIQQLGRDMIAMQVARVLRSRVQCNFPCQFGQSFEALRAAFGCDLNQDTGLIVGLMNIGSNRAGFRRRIEAYKPGDRNLFADPADSLGDQIVDGLRFGAGCGRFRGQQRFYGRIAVDIGCIGDLLGQFMRQVAELIISSDEVGL